MQQGLIMPARQHAAYPAQATSLPIRARFMDMLHANALLADALANNLMEVFARSFGASAPGHAALIGEAARLIIERLSLSDALYHDAEHTALVTLVAQDILRGRRLHQKHHRRRLAACHSRGAHARHWIRAGGMPGR